MGRLETSGARLEVRAILVAVAVLVLDQLTKSLVRGTLGPCGDGACDHLRLGPMWVVNVSNTGPAFSASAMPGPWVLTTLFGLSMVPVFRKRLTPVAHGTWHVPVALGLVTGGALGNLVDRIAFRGVTDFLSPGGYAVFNVADLAVVAGTAMTVAALIRSRRLAGQKAAVPFGVPSPVGPS